MFEAGDSAPWASGVHGPARQSPQRALTLVAIEDGEVVGFGSLMWSARHPDVVAAHLDVRLDRHRRGIGTHLLRELEQVAVQPIMWNIEPNGPADSFLRACGFVVVVSSVTSRIRAGVALAELDCRPRGLPAGITRHATTSLTAGMIQLYEQIYASCHLWAGRYTAPPGAPWISFAGPLLPIDGCVQVADDGDRPCAIVSLHAGPFAESADAFLAPTAVLAGSREERLATLTELIRAVLAAAITAGVESLNIEYDSTYPELTELAESFPSTVVERRQVWMRH